MKLRCNCGHVIDFSAEQRGQKVKCSQCGRKYRLPKKKKEAPPWPPPPPPKPGRVPSPGLDTGGLELDRAPSPEAPPAWEAEEASEAVEELPVVEEEAAESALQVDWDAGSLELDRAQEPEAPPWPPPPPPKPGREPAPEAPPAWEAQEADEAVEELPVIAEEVAESPLAAKRKERREEGERIPRTIFGLMWMCVKRPSLVGDIGIGGIRDPLLLSQIIVAFLVLIVLPAWLQPQMKERADTVRAGRLEEGFGTPADEGPAPAEAAEISEGLRALESARRPSFLKNFTSKLTQWLISALAVYIIAILFFSRAGPFAILTGMALVRVMAVLFFILLAAVTVGLGLLMPPAAPFFLLATMLGWIILVFIFQLHFLMGVFDLGYLAAFMMNFLVSAVAFVLNIFIFIGLSKLG